MASLIQFSGIRAPGLRLLGLIALLSSTAAFAQEQPGAAASDAAQAAEKRSAEWSVLASNLEQRVARLLPCDARVRSAIEEVSRASDARFTALAVYWQDAAKRSKEQAEAAGKLIAENTTRPNDARVAVWKADRADSEQQQTRLVARISALRDSTRQRPPLASAAAVLDGISQNSEAVTKQAAGREDMAAQWNARLNDLITASQSRQAAIENELKALTTESSRWSAYYAARITRAQMECSLTGSAGEAADPASRTKGKTGK